MKNLLNIHSIKESDLLSDKPKVSVNINYYECVSIRKYSKYITAYSGSMYIIENSERY